MARSRTAAARDGVHRRRQPPRRSTAAFATAPTRRPRRPRRPARPPRRPRPPRRRRLASRDASAAHGPRRPDAAGRARRRRPARPRCRGDAPHRPGHRPTPPPAPATAPSTSAAPQPPARPRRRPAAMPRRRHPSPRQRDASSPAAPVGGPMTRHPRRSRRHGLPRRRPTHELHGRRRRQPLEHRGGPDCAARRAVARVAPSGRRHALLASCVHRRTGRRCARATSTSSSPASRSRSRRCDALEPWEESRPSVGTTGGARRRRA